MQRPAGRPPSRINPQPRSQKINMATETKRQQSASHGTQPQAVVEYNAELFELWVNGTLVKRLDIRAANQIAILRAFQEEDWPPRIDDPLHPNGGDDKARLRSTIHCLNGRQHPAAIRFFADGSGHGIRWEFLPPHIKPESKMESSGKSDRAKRKS